ncbi:hypothetical protein [Hyphomonas sp.]|uniref:hypothetical protein n=1 Tax=Hyphomonas sp. TaxID=87 RepID=UPI00391DF1D7
MDRLELKFEQAGDAGQWAFWINGRPLKELFPQQGQVAGFSDPENPFHAAYRERLLGAPSDIAPEGRTPLLICQICGDIGCGAFPAKVEVRDATVTRPAFWWEAEYQEFSSQSCLDIRFEFDRKAYEAAINAVSFS